MERYYVNNKDKYNISLLTRLFWDIWIFWLNLKFSDTILLSIYRGNISYNIIDMNKVVWLWYKEATENYIKDVMNIIEDYKSHYIQIPNIFKYKLNLQ